MQLLCLLFLLRMPAAAESFPSCVVKTSSTTYKEPASLKELLDCQRGKLGRSSDAYRKRYGKELPEAKLERWQELQRQEVREFLRRHPKLATLPDDHPPGGTARPGQDLPESGAQAMDKDTEALKQRLWDESDQGRKGVTPEMADQIVRDLMAKQGFVSDDMAALLNAVQKDGPKLTEDTVLKLQDAARQAKANGMKLDIKPEMEVYNPSMFGEVENLIKKNLLKKPYYINCVMGVDGMGGYAGTTPNLLTMINLMPEGSVFNVSGIGRYQMEMNVASMIMGGNVRVGLEDNIYYKKGELFCDKVRVSKVLKKTGTPAYIYSYKTFTEHLAKLQKAFRAAKPTPKPDSKSWRQRDLVHILCKDSLHTALAQMNTSNSCCTPPAAQGTVSSVLRTDS